MSQGRWVIHLIDNIQETVKNKVVTHLQNSRQLGLTSE
jgi:hypothetical protein